MRTARGGRCERLRTGPGRAEANGPLAAGEAEGKLCTNAASTHPGSAGTDVAVNDPHSRDHTPERRPGTAACLHPTRSVLTAITLKPIQHNRLNV